MEPLLKQVAEDREEAREHEEIIMPREKDDDVRLAKDSSAWHKGMEVTEDDRQTPRLPWETFKVWF